MKDLKGIHAKQPGRLRFNKRFSIIVVCFLISTVFWLLLALSHDYPTNITFPVKYVNLPGKKVVVNDLPSSISVQVVTSGFKILSYEFQKEREPVEVNVASSIGNSFINSDILSIATKTFLPDFSRELGTEVSVTGFQPDSISFNLSDLVSKSIPIVVPLSLSFERQYDSTGRHEIVPAEVIVSGPPSIVDGLRSISTEKIILENLKETVKKNIKLIPNRLLTYNVAEVELYVPVEKFTEGSAEIEIHPMNVMEGYSIKTFPDRVKVRYLVALSHYNKVNDSMFDAVVDAAELKETNKSKLSVKLITSPFFVRMTKLEPEKVDYILRKQ